MLEHEVGRGGMGIVFRARDPTLDRTVALKLLRGRRNPQRLLREARALASLDHPNIIRIYDAGVFDGRVFLAMEFFEGSPFSSWVAQSRPKLARIAERFVRLTDALCAAHRLGIVHRDVKPANVLVDEGGETRVIDFGLARSVRGSTDDPDGENVEEAAPRRLDALTRNDQLIGTPGYMAPELWDGGLPSPEADAWSVGVMLFEATHGRRPFQSDDPEELRVLAQRLPSVAAGLPRAIGRTIEGLLDPDPAGRLSLLDARRVLDRVATRRSRRLRAAGLGIVLLGGVAGGAAVTGDPPCPPPERTLDGLWSMSVRSELASAWNAQGPMGATAWSRTEAEITERFDAWTRLRGEVCDAWSGTYDGEARADARRCLDRAVADLEVGVRSMREPTLSLVSHFGDLLERLADPNDCIRPEARAAFPPIPAEADDRRAAVRLRAAVTGVALARIAGRLDDALALADALEADVTELDDPSVQAELALERGLVLDALGRFNDAEDALRAALRLSLSPHHPHLRASAAVALAGTLGRGKKNLAAAAELIFEAESIATSLADAPLVDRVRLEQAEQLLAAEDWTAAGQAFSALLADPDSTLPRARRLRGLAASLIHTDQGRARTLLTQALEHSRRVDGDHHPRVAELELELGRMCIHDGDLERAAQSLARARDLRSAVFGASSAPVAEVDVALGLLAIREARFDDARSRLEWALTRLEADHDMVDLDLTHARSNLGVVYGRLGMFDEAIEAHTSVYQTVLTAVGPGHSRAGLPAVNLAAVHRRAGHVEQSIHWFRQAIRSVSIGRQRDRLRLHLADLLRISGDRAGARSTLAALRQDRPSQDAVVAAADLIEAEIELDTGRVPGDIESLAVQAMPAIDRDSSLLGVAALARARVARARGRGREAERLAGEALDAFREGVPVTDFDQRRVLDFLR